MKKNIRNTIALGMVLTVMGGTVAMAQNEDATSDPITSVSATDEKGSDVTANEDNEAATVANYVTTTGVIKEISDIKDGNVEVLIDNEQGGLRFVLSGTSIIVDRETGKYITASDLAEDMTVSVIYGALSPMGMSMPPYLGQVSAVVANADKGNYVVGQFDKDLVDADNQLKLNIGDDTVILTTRGTKSILLAEDVQNKDALVFYDVTTRSIPAQTTPSFILLLEKEEAIVDDKDEDKTDEDEATMEYVALRDTAEEVGFTVTWQGKEKAILVEKEGTSIEITLDSATISVNDEDKDCTLASKLVDGVLYVSAEVFE